MSAPYLAAAALQAAFWRVKENHGCAGADDVCLTAFEPDLDVRAAELRRAVEEESYWAWPLRRIEVEKQPGSEERRSLLVPAVRDRVLQTAVAAHIEPALEAEFDECSYAYRRGRSVRLAVERVYALYKQGYQWLVDADIESLLCERRPGAGDRQAFDARPR
jgi:retron-type reverse transcriptase